MKLSDRNLHEIKGEKSLPRAAGLYDAGTRLRLPQRDGHNATATTRRSFTTLLITEALSQPPFWYGPGTQSQASISQCTTLHLVLELPTGK